MIMALSYLSLSIPIAILIITREKKEKTNSNPKGSQATKARRRHGPYLLGNKGPAKHRTKAIAIIY